MTITVRQSARAAMVAASILAALPAIAAAQGARERYESALAREQKAREAIESTAADAASAARAKVIRQTREIMAAYEGLVRRFHGSGYSDNALWNAALLADALYHRFGRDEDRAAARRLINRLVIEYPSSSLIKQAKPKLAELESVRVTRAAAPAAANGPNAEASSAPAATPSAAGGLPMLTAIERTALPSGVRITLALDREVAFREERLNGPSRVFFDLKGVQPAPDLRDAVLRYTSDPVRQIRVGRHPDSTVRVVLDLEGVAKYSVFTLYNPFRVVIDAEPATAAAANPPPATPLMPSAPAATAPPAPVGVAAALPLAPATSPSPAAVATKTASPLAATPSPAALSPPPVTVAPSAPNAAGGFSLSRQLGLGISRIVIDPGHGGHDPGASVKGLTEADLTLDIALRVEELLVKEGFEVVLTRRTNVYIPLEERTAIANREAADLFLSIHANASRNTTARGVETYFLSFAATPEAEAVAARENSASSSAMHHLPDIIKAIALNNKLDESRDFAAMVQDALVTRLRRANKSVRNLGVKKAPFVVLIGAEMPSVLAEVSFLTNKQEASLLKSAAYKQRIAEALHAAVLRYRRSLKGQAVVAEK